jgi:hypothetical protein
MNKPTKALSIKDLPDRRRLYQTARAAFYATPEGGGMLEAAVDAVMEEVENKLRQLGFFEVQL